MSYKHFARFCFLAALIGLVTGCASLRLGFDSSRRSLFPLAVGNEWEYRLVTTFERGERMDTTTLGVYRHRITGTTQLADGKPAFVRVWVSEVTLRDSVLSESTFAQAETAYFRVTRNAVFRFDRLDGPPDTILILPLQLDEKWMSRGVFYWVSARETLALAGQSWPLTWKIQTFETRDNTPVCTWFAPGQGLVRMLNDRKVQGRRIVTDYRLVRAEIR